MYLGLVFKKHWHSLRKVYIQSMYDSCLDPALKQKLSKKMEHHEDKLFTIHEKLLNVSDQ